MFPFPKTGGGAPQQGAQAAAPADPVVAFYMQIFQMLDQAKRGVIEGKQVFAFFVTSGLHKGALAEIWDEAKAKQAGGLTPTEFVLAMNLIALAQGGLPPKRANMAGRGNLPPPKMEYPPNLQVSVLRPPSLPVSVSFCLFCFCRAVETQIRGARETETNVDRWSLRQNRKPRTRSAGSAARPAPAAPRAQTRPKSSRPAPTCVRLLFFPFFRL